MVTIMLIKAHKMYKLETPIISLKDPARMAPKGEATIINVLRIEDTLPILSRGTVVCITVTTITLKGIYNVENKLKNKP